MNLRITVKLRFSLLITLSVLASSCAEGHLRINVQAERVDLQAGGTKTGQCSTSAVQAKSGSRESTQGSLPSAETSSGSSEPSLDLWPPDPFCVGKDNGEICGAYSLCIMQRCMPSYCGDGVIMPEEECEDGNDEVDDGCDTCTIERCGDGIIHPGEECDDGNNIPTDGCNERCKRMPSNLCGNGRLDGKEECDDGNAVNDDECRNDCQKAPAPTCGNGKIDAGEECDDGRQQENDGCGPTCKLEVCGDGVISAAREQCDDGNTLDGDGCSSKCKVEYPVCGNGVVEWKEECDDGNNRNSDACPNDCQLAECGDGLIEGYESCDDGNTVAGDGCNSSCVQETECGNGVVEFAVGGEHCDDGNDNNFDRCPNDCKRPRCGDGRWGGADEECDRTQVPLPGQECDTECRIKPVCGNGVLETSPIYPELSEVCDDGNLEGGDGCEADCKSTVSQTLCGNGQLDPGEECDLGEKNDPWEAESEDFPKGKIGVCRRCRWTFFDEACSRCMGKQKLSEGSSCKSWGARPCNVVFNCYIENRCSSFYGDRDAGISAIAAMSCLCGNMTVAECTSATAHNGACQAIVSDPMYMFKKNKDGSIQPVDGTQEVIAAWLNSSHPSGRANGTVTKMARKCADECGPFMLSELQLKLGEEQKSDPKRRRSKNEK